MRIYHRVFIKEYPNGLVRFVRERMVTKPPVPLGIRYTSSIDHHISMRAGLFADGEQRDGYGLVSLERAGYPERAIRMYGKD